MVGDLPDVVSRLWSVLPKRWFAEESPNLSALLRSIATPWVWVHSMILYVKSQGRITTATDQWLDLIARDFFGSLLARKTNESDPNFRTRIRAALLREAGTRTAVSIGLEALTGRRPAIFEPANCGDAGSYGVASANMAGTGLAYGQAGGWGSLSLPLQFFVVASRAPSSGISMLSGYGIPNGGYGGGALSYADLSLLPGHVTDQEIAALLSSLLPVNAIAWLRIT